MELEKLMDKLNDIKCDREEILEVNSNRLCDMSFLIFKDEYGKIIFSINLDKDEWGDLCYPKNMC